LQRARFLVARSSGSRHLLVHASEPARRTTVPVHPGDLPRGLVRAIIRQARLTVEEFVALL
jgi:predicted RNA binding protein YcfA (HicA-like mRNA interferase family)